MFLPEFTKLPTPLIDDFLLSHAPESPEPESAPVYNQ